MVDPKLPNHKKVQVSELEGISFIMGYEPFFRKNVIIGSIFHNTKEVRYAHGYFPPHVRSKRTRRIARLLGYEMIKG